MVEGDVELSGNVTGSIEEFVSGVPCTQRLNSKM